MKPMNDWVKDEARALRQAMFQPEPRPDPTPRDEASDGGQTGDLRAARAMVEFVLDTSNYPDDHPIPQARRHLLDWFDSAIARSEAGGIDVAGLTADELAQALTECAPARPGIHAEAEAILHELRKNRALRATPSPSPEPTFDEETLVWAIGRIGASEMDLMVRAMVESDEGDRALAARLIKEYPVAARNLARAALASASPTAHEETP